MTKDRTKSYIASPNRKGIVLWRLVITMLAVVVLASTILTSKTAEVYGAAEKQRKATEYQIKAVYLYNFLLFVQWPKNNNDTGQPDKTITIGILGDDPFADSFAQVEGKLIGSKKKILVIERLGPYNKDTDLSNCQLLFIDDSEKKNFKPLLRTLSGRPVLTVADTKGFLEAGGIINLVELRKKIRWEINQTPAKLARLRLNSQLLRNAVRIVQIPEIKKQNDSDKNVATIKND